MFPEFTGITIGKLKKINAIIANITESAFAIQPKTPRLKYLSTGNILLDLRRSISSTTGKAKLVCWRIGPVAVMKLSAVVDPRYTQPVIKTTAELARNDHTGTLRVGCMRLS